MRKHAGRVLVIFDHRDALVPGTFHAEIEAADASE